MIRNFLLLSLPFMLQASSGGASYDIIERSFNFFLFAALLWYLLAKRVKQAHNDRIETIAKTLDSTQDALKKSAQKCEEARAKIQSAKDSVKILRETSKKELQILTDKLNEDLKNDIKNLEKAYTEQIELERRHMKREVVAKILMEVFDENSFKIDKKEFIDIVMKKVA